MSVNPAFCRLFFPNSDIDPASETILFSTLGHEGSPTMQELAAHRDSNEAVRQWEMAVGEGMQQRWIHIMLSRLEEGRLQGVAHDITKRRQAAEAAEKLATTDALTGIGNRLGFERRLSVIERHHRLYPGQQHALLVLDFDHFKQINDTYGHHAGDEVLKHVAHLLERISRRHDYPARLGGDEFVLLLDDRTPQSHMTRLAERLIADINQPIVLSGGQSVQLGVSIGMAVLGVDTDDVKALVNLADQAMYRAKREGRNTWRFHDANIVPEA